MNPRVPPFPYADKATIFNFSADVLALLPQLFVISHSEDDYCSTSTRDFVGLLGLARIFRLTFWTLNFFSNLFSGMPLMWLCPFVIPDLIHTLVMGQYIYLWVKKVGFGFAPNLLHKNATKFCGHTRRCSTVLSSVSPPETIRIRVAQVIFPKFAYSR